MTLATRCSACGTSFRVVQDQLKISGGWVRCGRCNEIFNAIEGLYEVGSPMAEGAGREPVPDQAARSPEREPVSPQSPAQSATDASASEDSPAAELARASEDARALEDAQTQGDAEAAEERRDQAPDVQAQGEALPQDTALAAKPSAPVPSIAAPKATEAAAAEAQTDNGVTDDDVLEHSPADDWPAPNLPIAEPFGPQPSFVVAAQRAERERRPAVRLARASAALALASLLGAQFALAYRDVIAAQWPGMRPPLQLACDWLGCRIEPMRHIAGLSVEASGLQQVGTAALYTLSVSLRNRSGTELMAPAFDLLLSDSQGKTIARKVLTMADLGRDARSIGAGAEVSGQATLSTDGQRVTGYTIEIFYP